MTVSSTVSSVIYNGNSYTTTFDVPFRFLENTDLKLSIQQQDGTVRDLVLNSDYTVTGANQDSGGSVTLAAPVGNNNKLSILRVMDLLQETDYRENERFPAESHERALDKLTFEVQQCQEQLDRAILVDVFSDVEPDVLRQHVERVWDSCDNIDIVANDKTNMDTVATNIASVKTNALNMADINTNATNISSINTNATNITDINLLADNMADINNNATNMSDINQVADIHSAVSTVAGIHEDVSTAAAYSTVISTVANVAEDVDALADVVPELINLSPIKQDIVTVGAHAQAIDQIGDNIELVIGAVPAAQTATTAAANAAASAAAAKVSEENAKIFGDIVRVSAEPTELAPVTTINFGRKVETGSFFNIYVDRVKLWETEYTLAQDGMSVTLSTAVPYGHRVLCEYIIGVPSAMINEMRGKVDDVLYERDVTAVGTLDNGNLVFDISSYTLDEHKRYNFHLSYTNTGVTGTTPVTFSETSDHILNKLVSIISPDFTTNPTVNDMFQVSFTSGTTTRMEFAAVATRDAQDNRGLQIIPTVNTVDTLHFYTKSEIDDIVDTLAPSSQVGTFVEQTNNRLSALESADTTLAGRVTATENKNTEQDTTLSSHSTTLTSLQSQVNLKAPTNSPALTGTPTAPTATAGTNTTQVATTAFVTTAVSNGVSTKAPLASPALTGTPTAPTAGTSVNNTQIATTAYVNNKVKYVTALPASPDANTFYFIPG